MYSVGPWQVNDGLQVGPVLCTWQDRGSSMMAYRWDQYCVHGSSMMAYRWEQYSAHDRTVAAQ